MTPKQLDKISSLLPVSLETATGIDRKTIWRWKNGKARVPNHAQEAILDYLEKHIKDCLKMLKSLKSSQ